jgi:hypothetical protein
VQTALGIAQTFSQIQRQFPNIVTGYETWNYYFEPVRKM